MEMSFEAVETPVAATGIERDLENHLDAICGLTATYKEAVTSYLRRGPDASCWQHARCIADELRAIEERQQSLEARGAAGVRQVLPIGSSAPPAPAVVRVLREMKRQVTGFAVESGFTGAERRVPPYLLPMLHALTEKVCAAVAALVDWYRPSSLPGCRLPLADEASVVSFYENQADRLSMQLLKMIFADDALHLEAKLLLAQLVEEIDNVADQAESIERELRADRQSGFVPGAPCSTGTAYAVY